MRTLALVCVLCTAAVAAVSLSAQNGPAPKTEAAALDHAADVIQMSDDAGSRLTVPVIVAGQGPYQFVVDTGAERTVISSELARRLDLKPGPSVRIHSMTEVENVVTRRIPSLEISKDRIEDVHAPAYPQANLGAAGMLGVDSLKSRRVVFDFTKKTMSILPSTKRQQVYGPDVIVVTGKSLYGRLVLVDARLEGEKVWVVVDSGSDVTIGNETLRRKLAARRKLRTTIPVEVISITGGKTIVDYTFVRNITLGGVTINNMPIGFADVHPFRQLKLLDRPAMLLGMDALRLFDRVSVDFARKEVRFLGPESSSLLMRTVHRAAGTPGSS